MSWLANANMREAATVRRIVEARGLCGPHWAKVLGVLKGDPGVAGVRLLSRIAGVVCDDLDGGSSSGRPGCPVCGSVRRRAESTIRLFLERLERPGGPAGLERSFGLCQPHLEAAVGLAPRQATLGALLRMQRRQIELLASRLVAASDARARADAAGRLVAKLAGSLDEGPARVARGARPPGIGGTDR